MPVDLISKQKYLFTLLFWSIFLIGCKKLVSIDVPVTSVAGTSVYSSNTTATAVLTGMYSNMSAGSIGTAGTIPSLSLYCELAADELSVWSGNTDVTVNSYYKNALSANVAGFEYWNYIYPFIFTCNSAIEGLNSSTNLTPAVKQQLQGEALFLRAYFYFYLINLYGDAALALSTDYKNNSTLARSPKAKIYEQIIADLKNSQMLLSSNYLDASLVKLSTERVRPTKWAASALLARVYLFANDYVNSEAQASLIINNSNYYKLVSLNKVFIKNDSEAIWQLQPVTTGITNTSDAFYFIIPPTGFNVLESYYLSSGLIASFEAGDNRKTTWINNITIEADTFYYPFKYKVNTADAPVSEYIMMLRLGEQYLIRAESRAQQGELTGVSGAIADLNIVRNRAGLPAYSGASDKGSVLTAILHERQVELFAESGHRWFDLKRTGGIDVVMATATPAKGGGSWNTNQQLLPLPVSDLQRDGNLTQNPAY